VEGKKLAKLGVVVIFILAVLYTVGVVLVFALAGAPIVTIVAVLVFGLVILGVLGYVVLQRFREINEGLEDAVNDY